MYRKRCEIWQRHLPRSCSRYSGTFLKLQCWRQSSQIKFNVLLTLLRKLMFLLYIYIVLWERSGCTCKDSGNKAPFVNVFLGRVLAQDAAPEQQNINMQTERDMLSEKGGQWQANYRLIPTIYTWLVQLFYIKSCPPSYGRTFENVEPRHIYQVQWALVTSGFLFNTMHKQCVFYLRICLSNPVVLTAVLIC